MMMMMMMIIIIIIINIIIIIIIIRRRECQSNANIAERRRFSAGSSLYSQSTSGQ